MVFGYGSLIWKVRTTASLGTLGITRGWRDAHDILSLLAATTTCHRAEWARAPLGLTARSMLISRCSARVSEGLRASICAEVARP